MKKFIALLLTVVLTASVAIGGTVAYLQDSARNDNTMTLGKVDIEQWEYQRKVNEDGTYATGTYDNQTSYVLEAFEQDKPLLPSTVVVSSTEWDPTIVRMTQIGSFGGMQTFVPATNAQDKFVVVKNTGKTDAYVRTLVAIECGAEDKAGLFGSSYHSAWTENDGITATIDGKTYVVLEYVYKGGAHLGGVHANGILPAGQMAYPSFCQVYLHPQATNEDMTIIDANGNGKVDILVLSQAVQAGNWTAAEGKTAAETALDAAFGDVNAANVATWFAANP